MIKNNKKGFTLIELLVVIAIIGILASIVLVSLNTARKRSRDTRRIADVRQLQLALELYFDSNKAYPATLSSLAPTYIPVISTDPNGGAYLYAAISVSGSCTSYHLGATLEDSSNSALSSDADAVANSSICTGSGADFTGTDPIYDVKP